MEELNKAKKIRTLIDDIFPNHPKSSDKTIITIDEINVQDFELTFNHSFFEGNSLHGNCWIEKEMIDASVTEETEHSLFIKHQNMKLTAKIRITEIDVSFSPKSREANIGFILTNTKLTYEE